MEDKTKSTLAHVASIATAVAGIITALVTGSSNDAKGEKVYEILKERVTIQGEHIKRLEEDNRELKAMILKSPWTQVLFKEASAGIETSEPNVPFKTLISKDDTPDEKTGASAPPPEVEHLEEELHQSNLQEEDFGQMPSYESF